MGNCVGGANGQENVFKVTNINDDKDLVQKGLMEVTNAELIYTDSKSEEDWHWPLKFLRKYGCDGNVFTFEAGRKCPGGEGLYAFSTRKANVLFEIVARNINQGNLQPSGDMSPFSESHPDPNMLNFPQRQPTNASTTQDQPSYTNLDLSGKPLENGSSVPQPSDSMITSPPVVYREVIFDKPPEEHPRPAQPNIQKNSSYTRIDFDETNKFNEKRKRGDITSSSSLTITPHSRTASTSTGRNTSPTKRTGKSRSRVHTYTSGTRDVSRSEGSYGSQSSLTESSRDIRSRGNGAVPHMSVSDPPLSTYQNVNMALAQEQQQQQYQNVHVGTNSVSQVFDSQQQPNYCNVSLSPGADPANILTGNGVEHGKPRASSVKVNGADSMTTYAQLELSSRSASAAKDSGNLSYGILDFPKAEASVAEETERKRRASTSAIGSHTENSHHRKPGFPQHHNIPEEEPAHIPAMDDTKVTYGTLDFTSMQAVAKLSTQREEEREQEKERREKASAQSSSKKKK